MNEKDEIVKIVLGLVVAFLTMLVDRNPRYEYMTILDCIKVPPEMTSTILACPAVIQSAASAGFHAFIAGYAVGSIVTYVLALRKS